LVREEFQRFILNVLTTDSHLILSQTRPVIHQFTHSPFRRAMPSFRPNWRNALCRLNSFINTITLIGRAEGLMEKWKAKNTRMNLFEQMFADFDDFTPEFTADALFELKAAQRFISSFSKHFQSRSV
jgi:hypothetical protein